MRECLSFGLAGDTGQVDAQPAKVLLFARGQTNVCVCVRACGNYFFCVCADGVIRVGWWVEGLSEVISPSHLIIGSLADSLGGSTARRGSAAVNRAVKPAEIDANLPSVAIFILRSETWAFDKDAAS